MTQVVTSPQEPFILTVQKKTESYFEKNNKRFRYLLETTGMPSCLNKGNWKSEVSQVFKNKNKKNPPTLTDIRSTALL